MSSSRTVKVKILDEVNAAVIGLTPDHLGFFHDEYARKAPNFFFNPKYKLGQWDGKIRYFHKNGKTYVYLLDDIVPQLIGLGYKIDLIDDRQTDVPGPQLIDKYYFQHIVHPEWGENIILRDYQVESVNKLILNGGGLIIAGTGAGKTLMCAALADSYGNCENYGTRTITIVPSMDLIEQTAVEYEICELDTGRYYSEVKTLEHQHVVSTWQSLKNNPGLMNDFDLVIVDECHGAKGQELQKLLNEHGPHIPLRFGFTGTLPKAETDAMAVRISLGDVQHSITARQLMDEGHLAKLDIQVLQLEEDFEKEYKQFLDEEWEPTADKPKPPTYRQFKDGYFPDYQSEKRYLQTNKDRMQWIADYIEVKRDMGKGNVFCLVDGVQNGRKLAGMIDGAIFVHGKDKMKARKEIYELFRDNDNLVVIATIHIASTGLNIKRIFHMMAIDVGKSFIRIIQTIGRGLRKAPDKDFVEFSDICSDLKYSRKHLTERKKFYREAQYPHKIKKIKYADF
jgi:superfamily II DNA or RNA helicase